MRYEHSEAEHVEGQRLGYLLKHGWLRLTELIDAALEPHDIDGREWVVLLRLGETDPISQQDLAYQLGIDRTTMVAFVDSLERKDLVERRPHPADRRKNVVELTAAGRETLHKATKAGDAAEREFLSSLNDRDTEQLKRMLRTILDRG